jgi:hypothetical protein
MPTRRDDGGAGVCRHKGRNVRRRAFSPLNTINALARHRTTVTSSFSAFYSFKNIKILQKIPPTLIPEFDKQSATDEDFSLFGKQKCLNAVH